MMYTEKTYTDRGEKISFLRFENFSHETKLTFMLLFYGLFALNLAWYDVGHTITMMLFVVPLVAVASFGVPGLGIAFMCTLFLLLVAIHGAIYPFRLLRAALDKENARHDANMAKSKSLQEAIDRLNNN